jgi:hypothetical protein
MTATGGVEHSVGARLDHLKPDGQDHGACRQSTPALGTASGPAVKERVAFRSGGGRFEGRGRWFSHRQSCSIDRLRASPNSTPVPRGTFKIRLQAGEYLILGT